jgi:hypothetical protein
MLDYHEVPFDLHDALDGYFFRKTGELPVRVPA